MAWKIKGTRWVRSDGAFVTPLDGSSWMAATADAEALTEDRKDGRTVLRRFSTKNAAMAAIDLLKPLARRQIDPYVAAIGDAFGGIVLHGPFANHNAALDYGHAHANGEAFEPVHVKPVDTQGGGFHYLADAERDVVIAALRLWQRTASDRVPEWDIACNGSDEPLSNGEIDTLCEQLNC